MKTVLLTGGILTLLFSFCTRETVTDADGNVYSTVRIGGQVWTVENLRTTKWSDGAPIPYVPDSVAWHSLASPGFCYYGNTTNADSIVKFGALYNWYCVDSKKLAPKGWHVPTDNDWTALEDYLIKHGYNWDKTRSENRIAKSLAAQTGWKWFEIEGMPGNAMKDNNRSGFSGLPVGYRFDTHDTIPGFPPLNASFSAFGHKAGWWSATLINKSFATVYGLGFCVESTIQRQTFYKTCGYSVRLVKDEK